MPEITTSNRNYYKAGFWKGEQNYEEYGNSLNFKEESC